MSLATVFQLAHVVVGAEFKTIKESRVEEEWMVHQIQSRPTLLQKAKL